MACNRQSARAVRRDPIVESWLARVRCLRGQRGASSRPRSTRQTSRSNCSYGTWEQAQTAGRTCTFIDQRGAVVRGLAAAPGVPRRDRPHPWRRVGRRVDREIRKGVMLCGRRCSPMHGPARTIWMRAQTAGDGVPPIVRVAARGTASGSIEFAIQQLSASRAWGELSGRRTTSWSPGSRGWTASASSRGWFGSSWRCRWERATRPRSS